MTHEALLLLLAALALTACERRPASAPASLPASAPTPTPTPMPMPTPASASAPAAAREPEQASDRWRDYAKPADADRLARLSGAWDVALKLANDQGHADELAALGPLADPHARALARPHPAPGDYRCRTIKLGGTLGFVSYPWFKCRVELTPGGDLTLTRTGGSQRSAGKLYPDTDTRLIFLGAQAWGVGEEKAPAYGAAPERDQIGVLERIGETRWRLALPWPRVESDLDLMDIRR